MPRGDAWDWPLLLYTATVLLKRTEKQFWRMSPRKLQALVKVHVDLNNGDTETDEPKAKQGFIDQIF